MSAVPFATFTVIEAERVLPAASYAFTIKVYAPFALVKLFHEKLYAETVPLAYNDPFTKSSTFVTPTLSDAVPLTATVPETVTPAIGALIATLGAVVSVLFKTFTETEATRALPAASYALTDRLCGPLGLPELFHEKLKAETVPVLYKDPLLSQLGF